MKRPVVVASSAALALLTAIPAAAPAANTADAIFYAALATFLISVSPYVTRAER